MVIIIDNYDSFTYNLYQYVGEYDQDIKVYRNDKITSEEILELRPDRIIISPGPGTPDNAGNCIDIITKVGKSIPILGICLGHQSIGKAFGGNIVHAKELYHGKKSTISHNGEGIFTNIENLLEVARYHSLAIEKETLPSCLEITAYTDDNEIMAIRHRELNITGLQFHPESIMTVDGKKLIKNFIDRSELI